MLLFLLLTLQPTPQFSTFPVYNEVQFDPVLGLSFPSPTKDYSWVFTEPPAGFIGGAIGYGIGYWLGYASTKSSYTVDGAKTMGRNAGAVGTIPGAAYGLWLIGSELVEKEQSSFLFTFLGALVGGIAGYGALSGIVGNEEIDRYPYVMWSSAMLGSLIAFRLTIKKE
ncbi:MAG: hypothetical protein PHX21_09375 [bacterium]|nr:hypothetical protein [bacterium]